MPNTLPADLVNQARQKKLVPFVGAGMSLGVKRLDGEKAFPSWINLFENGADFLKSNQQERKGELISLMIEIGDSSPQNLADTLKKYLDSQWGRFILDSFDIEFKNVDPASLMTLWKLWQISDGLIITTNYDRSLSWATDDRNVTIWNTSAPLNHGEYQARGIRGKTVWHLHGSVNDASQIVLDSASFARLYSEEDQGLKSSLFLLRSILAENSLLFVGFSFKDEFFVEQMVYLRKMFHGSGNTHYAIVHESEVKSIDALNLGLHLIPVSSFDPGIGEALDLIINAIEQKKTLSQ